MRPSRDADQTMVTVLCVVGAVAGGFAGQVTRLYVFGEPLGFIFSAGGAVPLPAAEVALFAAGVFNAAFCLDSTKSSPPVSPTCTA